jgi:hypothetical protein
LFASVVARCIIIVRWYWICGFYLLLFLQLALLVSPGLIRQMRWGYCVQQLEFISEYVFMFIRETLARGKEEKH